jgi:hypothetical protein
MLMPRHQNAKYGEVEIFGNNSNKSKFDSQGNKELTEFR